MAFANFPAPYDPVPVAPSWAIRGRLSRFSVTDFSESRTRYSRNRGGIFATYDLVWYNLDLTNLTTLVNFWLQHFGLEPITWTDPVSNVTYDGFLISNITWDTQADGSFNAQSRIEVDVATPTAIANNLPINPSAVVQTDLQHLVTYDYSDNRTRYARKRGLPYAIFDMTFSNKALADLILLQRFWGTYYPGGQVQWLDPATGYDWDGYIVSDLEWEAQAMCDIDIKMRLEMVRVVIQDGNPGSGEPIA